ncbi:PREDICTED: programmed cell death protein 7-like [Amphimedon queenslandica]|uniref:Uncharacterized protein n=1 Tax=Amphimedon queenslandica TaxID=400682 RepID=A0A1X7VIB2_AMPQE|nr:PREDICTED: programmed cell death protein 7-like [Amphimedon queenslandica]|eukprot:XP_011410328.1 PREDICTED: programmed cell death protein 7-like [Amphimedon queenslandica]
MFSNFSSFSSYPLHTDAGIILQQWEATLRTRQPHSSRKPKLNELMTLMKSAEDHVSKLETLHKQLSSSESTPTAAIPLWSEVTERRQSLETTLDLFTPQTRRYMKRRLNRYKRKKLKRKREEEERERENDIKSNKVQEWFDKKCKEELRARLEKAVEESASDSLTAVKSKKDDVTYYYNLLSSLKDLREHRRSKRDKGDLPPVEEDEAFTENCVKLESILSKYTEIYKKEEHALRVMMSERVDSAITDQFGRKTARDKMKIMSTDEFYNTKDPDIIEERRLEWNKYLSIRGTPLPLLPIEAPPPSNETWSYYLKEK